MPSKTWLEVTSPTVSTSINVDTSSFTFNYTALTAATFNLWTQATSSGATKTVNIGTGGATGSTTNVTIGSTSGTSLNTINGTLVVGINGSGHTPTNVSLAGFGVVWNKDGNGLGATYLQNYRQGGAGGFVFELYNTNGISPSLVATPLSISGMGNCTFSESVLSTSPTGGIGYGAGAGGEVTQITSKDTNVTLNKISGKITMNNAALAAGATVSFYVFNSTVGIRDVVVATAQDGFSGNYLAQAYLLATGAFAIRVTNTSGSSQSEAAIINFVVIKAVSS